MTDEIENTSVETDEIESIDFEFDVIELTDAWPQNIKYTLCDWWYH